jgi:hypothetical protein
MPGYNTTFDRAHSMARYARMGRTKAVCITAVWPHLGATSAHYSYTTM